jgi:hypothetical protein
LFWIMSTGTKVFVEVTYDCLIILGVAVLKPKATNRAKD